jgi:hypothetical protein
MEPTPHGRRRVKGGQQIVRHPCHGGTVVFVVIVMRGAQPGAMLGWGSLPSVMMIGLGPRNSLSRSISTRRPSPGSTRTTLRILLRVVLGFQKARRSYVPTTSSPSPVCLLVSL